MSESLISLLIAVLIFGLLAYGLYMLCVKFWPEFPPARWICGVILLIVLLMWIGGSLPGPVFPRLR
jgi:hypothetical protein